MRALSLLCVCGFCLVACGGRIAPDAGDPGPTGVIDRNAAAAQSAPAADGEACGGPAHITCSAGAYCWADGCAVTGEQHGACFRPAGGCESGVDVPACGCNGKLYANACEAITSGVGWSGQFEGDPGCP